MTELSCTIIDENDLKLIRHVKTKYINNGEFSDEVFQLREDKSPPEDHISFFHSALETIADKINEVRSFMLHRKYSIKKTSGFLYLDAFKASEEINLTNEIVKFEVCNYPHYGMYYLSEDIMDITEAKTILIHHSKLYMDKGHNILP